MAKDSAKEKAAKAREKEKAAKAREKEKAAKAREKEKAAKAREKEKAAKAREMEKAAKAREKEKAAKAKAKEKAAKAKAKEKAAKDKATKAEAPARAAEQQTVTDATAAPEPDAVTEPDAESETDAGDEVDTEADDSEADTADVEADTDEDDAEEEADEVAALLEPLPESDKTVRERGYIAEALGREDAVGRSTQRATIAASYTTRDHDIIRAWAISRGGVPADVAGTGRGHGAGVLRIEFPDGPGDDSRLEDVDWAAFFATFDDSDVDFLYQERLRTGDISRFHKFVRQDA